MKKIYFLLVLWTAALAGPVQAQRIKAVLPDTVLALAPGETDTVYVRTEGVSLLQQNLWYAQLHLPSCQVFGRGAPLYNNLGQSARIMDDSTIRIIVYDFPENLVRSTLDIDVGMLGGLKMHRDRAMTAYSPGPLEQFPPYTLGPVTARPGETIDVLISNTQHVPAQTSSTLAGLDTSTLTVDFKTNAYAIVVMGTQRAGSNTLATITVPVNARPGCYDAYFWEMNGDGLIYAQILNNAICVAGPPVEYPARVRGSVYADRNGNCRRNSLEPGLKNAIVKAMPGPHYAITDDTGAYEMQLPMGTYTVTQLPYCGTLSRCQTAGVTVSLDTTQPAADVSIGDSIGNLNDLAVALWMGRARIGTEGSGVIQVTMAGTASDSAWVKLVLDDSLHFLRSYPMPSRVAGDTLMYKLAFISPYHSPRILFDYSLPANIDLMNDSLTSCVSIKGYQFDADLANNQFCGTRIATSSYDPNEKSVFPKNNLNPSDSVLRYTIDFQNTGNDTAYVVVLRDTISPMLDLATIRTTYASHSCKFSLKEPRVAEWRFANIMLPDSGRNLARSQGGVQFTINRRRDLPLGSRIENRAAIIFDINPPVITNRTQTLYQSPVRVKEAASADGAIRIYPNPLHKGQCIVWVGGSADLAGATLTLTDMLGKAVVAGRPIRAGQVALDGAALKPGLYHYRIGGPGRVAGSGKLAVE